MKRIVVILLFCFFTECFISLHAQQARWHEYVEQLAEEEGMNEAAIENLFQELFQLESNPLDLNRATRDQLERIPFLSLEEVTAITTFLEKNRPLYSVFELRNVPYLDMETVERILPFFYAGNNKQNVSMTPSALLHGGKHEAQLRFDKTVTPRAGYGDFSDSILARYPNRKYRGEDFYTSLRYSFHYRDKIQMGITAEKDAGEPFFKQGYPRGYDHYGLHLIARHIGILNTVALGDFRLSFGQGLILNNDFMIGKSWSPENIVRRTQQPKRHFSTAESGFFRGAAAVAGIGDFTITAFYSLKGIDANLSEEGTITSFKTDGLHRTPLEIAKKRNTREQVTGGNINYRKNRFQAGISGLYHAYDRVYQPSPKKYNLYYLRDSNNGNASIDYSYQLPGFIFAGETAISKNGSVATLHTLQYRPSADISFSALHRYYPISYNALYAQAFSEGSSVRNERGLFLSVLFTPFRRFSVNTYLDIVRFPWLKFGVDTPSKALDFYFLGTCTLSSQSLVDIRYKYKQKEKNLSWPDEQSTSVLPYATHKLRLRYTHSAKNGWEFRTTADMARYTEKHFPPENGYMLSQNIGYRGKSPVSGDFYVAFFDANTYDVRLYSYERNLLNSFYMPSFYGKGSRLALSVKHNASSTLTLSMKAGHTRYFNRHTIGSGTEQIDGKRRTDLFFYLRWKF
ncbi:helix-hairpin-helix domain-containing protein [Proteiniphilum sp. UBA1028]|jgi:hypothetical protein|uniref:helix-hairpin-helix domain-containing protein n=1 Tax=Proteiniphilum sp. UBA1028 TaxID=1947251 RepID=UPI000E86E3E7|nr:helix-hairpin-helix domain-containing protein [Proteiniphilum sp. UBA1028]HBG56859.1 hypothetical protein [Porphyromonadaceae bacterium]